MKFFISELQQEGIFLQLDGDSIIVKSKTTPIHQEILVKLKASKNELVSYLKSNPDFSEIQSVEKKNKQQGIQLSSQQMSLWPLYNIGQSSTYNIPMSYDFHGELDEKRLTKALIEVYGRYDSLHSVFVEEEDEVLLRSNLDYGWSPESFDGDEIAVQKAYELEQNRHFDLTQDSLFVARLIKLSDTHVVLILNFPHIIIDGWSIDQLWRDISDIYNGNKLEPLAVDYLDYLSYQNEQPKQQNYWIDRLAKYETFKLHNVGFIDKNEPHIRYTELNPNDTEALRDLAKQNQVSVFTAAMSLLGKTLCCYTGQEDVVVSTPYANRENSQSSRLVGYLLSMVPVHYRRNIELSEFQQELHKDFSAANADFNQLLPALKLQSHEGFHPLQQVVFAWQDGVLTTPLLSGVEVKRRNTELVTPKFPLMLSMHTVKAGIQMKWEFNPSQISSKTVNCIERLLIDLIRNGGHFTAVAPELSAPQESDDNVLMHLKSVVRKTPNTIAVRYGDSQVTYEKLWNNGKKIASQLQAKGVKPGDRVGLMLPRTESLAYAIIGIVMTGGVYVPLRADDSSERQGILANQCRMKLCLTVDESFVITGVKSLCVGELLKVDSYGYKQVSLTGTSPIYINFSSGTSGEPKGIECVHQGVVRLVKPPNYMELNSDIRMLCAAALAFDAFTLEFWAPLLNGGQLCLMTEPQLDTQHLRYLIAEQGVNTLLFTAALFHAMVDIDPTAFNGVQQLLVGGEVVSPAHVGLVYKNNQHINIINAYGPTEDTTITSYYKVPLDWPEHEALPIGAAVSGSDVFILDKKSQVVSQGCIGEITTTGLGLAKGYLKKEQNTGRFVVLESLGGIRGYRSGDLGYIDNEGLVRFVGRNDQQVKINGFRIELEAINRVLCGLSSIQNGETLAVGEKGKQQLVSFVQPYEGSELEESKIKQGVSVFLPSFMIPRSVLCVDALPLTRNGKVDRSALLKLYNSTCKQKVNEALQLTKSDENKVESKLKVIWLELTGKVALAESTLTSLGACSMANLKLKRKLFEVFNVKLTVSELFVNATFSSQLHLLSKKSNDNQEATYSTE